MDTNSRVEPSQQTLNKKVNFKARIYVWATGQDDNIGDSLLRRGYLEALRQLGGLTIWTGPASTSFNSGLGLQGDDLHTPSFAVWYWSALRSAVRNRTFIAMNAGEVPVSRKGAVRLAALSALSLVCHARGGGGIWVGAGVPNTHALLALPYKAAAHSSVFVRWRDATSATNVVNSGTAPDWAFATGSSVSEWRPLTARTKLAIILRGDRPRPSEKWIAWIRSMAENHNLQPTLVVQVKRDSEVAHAVADTLGGDVLPWQEGDHAAQESAVRRLYAQSALVIGDRLHGLILGATEGAIPLGWVPSSNGKIDRHFVVTGLDWVGEHEGSAEGDLPPLSAEDLVSLRQDLEASVTRARSDLGKTVTELRATVQSR